MPHKETEPTQPLRLKEVTFGKAVSFKDGEGKSLREGTKPSAPANLVLPKPVAIPAPAASNHKQNVDEK